MESLKPYRNGSVIMVIALLFISCGIVSAIPSPLLSAGIPALESQGPFTSAGPAQYWLSIDPLPLMKAHEGFTISGKGTIPDQEYINLHIHLSSSEPSAVTAGHNSSDISSLFFMRDAYDHGSWSQTIEPLEFTPDQCLVEIKVVQLGVYTTTLWPSDYPGGLVNESASWIRLDAPGPRDMDNGFLMSGTTSLPPGSPLIVEIYPREFKKENYWQYVDYRPILREKISVQQDADGGQYFALPVNLTGAAEQSGMTISPGTMYIEVHAVNMASSVSDQAVFEATTRSPWITIDPIQEPVQGEKLTITGTTNLPEGSAISLNLGVMIHPCFRCGNPDAAPGSYCCGKCTTGDFSGNVPVTDTGGAVRSWKYETPTANWCTSETYYITAGADVEGKSTQENKYFHIRKT